MWDNVFSLLAVLATLSNLLTQYTSSFVTYNNKEIYDFGHSCLREIKIPTVILDVLIIIQWLYFVVNGDHFDVDEALIIVFKTFIIKSVCVWTTRLPCLKEKDNKRFFGGHGDYILSGHSIYSALLFCYMGKWFVDDLLYLLLFILYTLLFNVTVITSRNHYTVDVFLSWCFVLVQLPYRYQYD